MTIPPYDTLSNSSQREVEAPLWNKCCFFIPLRIGCFILGYLNLVYNVFHTLSLLAIITVLGVTTHGFDHVDDVDRNGEEMPEDLRAIERPYLTQMGLLLILVLLVNLAWLLVNIACLVGLHKKRPGPIRVYIAFATTRFVLCLIGFIYLVISGTHELETIVAQSLNLVLGGYFVLVYYVYAKRLEREQDQGGQVTFIENNMSHMVLAYPTKVDKENLSIA